MEPITLIMTALVTGAKIAATDVVPDVYKALKTLIQRKFAGEPKAEIVLSEYEKDPETYEAPLKKKLAEAGADKDAEIIKKAEELLKQLNPEESASGKYNIVFQGEVKGGQFGDLNTQTNTFSS